MEDVLGSAGIGKIQQDLLKKSAQNRVLGLRLGQTMVVAKYLARSIDFCIPKDKEGKPTKPNPIDIIIEFCEDNQMVLQGRSRLEFLEAIKGLKLDVEEEALEKK